MAAEVTSLHRLLTGFRDDMAAISESGAAKPPTALITRDLLGDGRSAATADSSIINYESQELDLDLQVPNGWEKRLDLKSGKVYLQRCNTQKNSASPAAFCHGKFPIDQKVPKFQDLNFPPSPKKPLLDLFDESCLDLKLVSSTPPPSTINYQSVCTLDKVKTALERAEKEPQIAKKRSSSSLFRSSMSSPSYSSSSSSIKDTTEEENEEKGFSSPVAVGCSGCLSYVLVMKNDPKCPRCNSVVPVPVPGVKKPRIDLNMSI